MSKVRVATVWLDGCSGCHMSFLDMDERLIALAERIDLVHSPLVDRKVFPERVDVTLVEGAVATEGDLEKIRHVRAHTKVLVALGDCAVTSNVPSMRNGFPVAAIVDRAYRENVTVQAQTPSESIPAILPQVRPVHECVHVDVFIPGCPPSADTIYTVVADLLAGRAPHLPPQARFG
jgi:NAD-reducing hydrogenase small subunit